MDIVRNAIIKIKEFCEDLEYEWFTYTHLRKFIRLNNRLMNKLNGTLPNRKLMIGLRKILPIMSVVFIFLFFVFLKILFADSQGEGQALSHIPEPASIALVGSGLFGIIVRFVRKRFQDFKRGMDILLSSIGLVLASPIFIGAAIAIKLTSPGPVFFRQKRLGKAGMIFDIYKLRTMKIDAEKETGAVWAKQNDSRVTPVGRILRNIHIDEIPQLVNVLRGEMSIVGPRPERPEIAKDLKKSISDYEKRLNVRPGITGLAQVVRHKYDETIDDVKKKIKYDLLYIREMCLMVDLRILARTILVVLTGKGAR